jgi:hypothetical protein
MEASMNQETLYRRLATLATAKMKGYNNFSLVTCYNEFHLTLQLDNESGDTLNIRCKGEELHEVINEAWSKYSKFTHTLREFDPNKAIEYVEAED